MIVKRHFALQQRNELRNKGYVIVVTGQRRSGKSTFLKQLASPGEKVLEIDFELMSFDHIRDYKKLYEFIKENISQKSYNIITIDEIQLVVDRERAILSLLKEYPHIDIVVTGSNSHLISSDLTTQLRGRYMHIHLLPFSYDEFCVYHKYQKSQDSFNLYLEKGGFPGAYLFDSVQHKERIDSLINTIFIKDIIERFQVRQISLLRELFLYLVYNAGNLTNISRITEELATKGIITNRNTVSDYLQYLIQAYMIYPIEVYDIAGKSIFDRIMKFYTSDHSRRKILFGSFDDGWSKTLETVCCMEAMRNGRRTQVGRIKNYEIDFIFTKGGEKKYVQISYLLSSEEVVMREFGSFDFLQKNHYKKYVISCDKISLGNKNGVQHILFPQFERIFKD